MLLQAILIAAVAVFAYLHEFTGTSFINRPLVTGPLVGLVLGDLEQGLVIGAALELVWMGVMGIGAAIPPDVASGGILGTAIAIYTGNGVEVALALALPIATLMLIVQNFIYIVIRPILAHKADGYASKGEIDKASNLHLIATFIEVLTLSLLVGVSFYLGSSLMEKIVNFIPKILVSGMDVATGLLPALGFALLIQMIMNKKVAPFFFLGFILVAYLNIPVLGIAMLGVIVGVVMLMIYSEIDKNKGVTAEDDF